MASFFEMLAMNAPSIPTREALVLIGLQNDLVTPAGLLASNADDEYLDRVAELADRFRPYGSIIWVRSEYDPAVQRATADEWSDPPQPLILDGTEDDPELFLQAGRSGPQACLKGSTGAEFCDRVKPLVQQQDIQLVKDQYSAFTNTKLLFELRCRLIAKLYICGAFSNVAVYATAIDAARSGMEVVLVEDCLAYRHQDRHERALKCLGRSSAARRLTKDQVLHFLRHPEDDVEDDVADETDSEAWTEEDDLAADLDALEVDGEASDDEMVLPAVGSTLAALSQGVSAKRKFANDDSTMLPSSSRGIFGNTYTHHNTQWHDSPPPEHLIQQAMDIPHHCLVKTWVADQEGMAMDTARVRHSIPLFGEDNAETSYSSTITYDLLDDEAAATAFTDVQNEVTWERMLHQTGEVPRLVCCQGTLKKDGDMPVYRHPSDKTILAKPWTPVVDRIRLEAEKVVGHELNHGLIQLYRSGSDFISEHSDKTLDIEPSSTIVNVSLGAERTMRLRSKRVAGVSPAPPRETHRVRMPHNSMISMSLQTNAVYLHGINADKRPRVELTEDELAYEGARISLTFRYIHTFVTSDEGLIWGAGAVSKTAETARPVISGDKEQSDRLILAFGQENQSSVVDWQRWYGDGSDVLHLK